MFPIAPGDEVIPPWKSGEAMRRWRKPLDWEADFWKYEKGRNLSERSIKTYIWALRVITRSTGKEVWEITPPDLMAFMETSPYPPRTTAQIVAAAKQGHKWAAVRGLCALNGVMAVSPPKIPKTKPRSPVSLETARRLLGSVRTPYETRLVFLGLYAGTRVSESAEMDATHDKGDRLRFVGKGDQERDVPIHPELRDRLGFIFSTPPPSLGTLGVTMRRLRDRVGAITTTGEPCTAHALRRTCGSTMYANGAAWEVADTVLGHTLPGAGARYIEIGWERLVAAIGRLDYYAGTVQQLALW
jgi:site-specific recombinase XerD